MELRCVQSMLEEVVSYWKKWNHDSKELRNWLEKAFSMLDIGEEEKMEYFQVSALGR